MADVEPLPLIEPSEDDTSSWLQGDTVYELARYGRMLLWATWLLFVVTINSIFELWRWAIAPLAKRDSKLHAQITLFFEKWDYVVISLWCIYVVAWWWALFSWIGMKLFRQSKGIQT